VRLAPLDRRLCPVPFHAVCTRFLGQISLYGPALSSPDGTATSGSTFAFSTFSDAAGTMPVLTNNTSEGFAFTIDVNLDGTTTVTNFSAQTTVVPPTPPAIPEPSTLSLMAVGVGLWLAFSFRPLLR
jgi:hypothetical protein